MPTNHTFEIWRISISVSSSTGDNLDAATRYYSLKRFKTGPRGVRFGWEADEQKNLFNTETTKYPRGASMRLDKDGKHACLKRINFDVHSKDTQSDPSGVVSYTVSFRIHFQLRKVSTTFPIVIYDYFLSPRERGQKASDEDGQNPECRAKRAYS